MIHGDLGCLVVKTSTLMSCGSPGFESHLSCLDFKALGTQCLSHVGTGQNERYFQALRSIIRLGM